MSDLLARGRAKIGRGRVSAAGRSVDDLVAATKPRRANVNHQGFDVEAKIAAARGRMRARQRTD